MTCPPFVAVLLLGACTPQDGSNDAEPPGLGAGADADTDTDTDTEGAELPQIDTATTPTAPGSYPRMTLEHEESWDLGGTSSVVFHVGLQRIPIDVLDGVGDTMLITGTLDDFSWGSPRSIDIPQGYDSVDYTVTDIPAGLWVFLPQALAQDGTVTDQYMEFVLVEVQDGVTHEVDVVLLYESSSESR